MSVNTKQVGGTHYKNDHQHWDLMDEFNIPYLEGCATKYPTRWKEKDGWKDIEKAIHFCEKIIQRIREHNKQPREVEVDIQELVLFSEANDLTVEEFKIIQYIINWRDEVDLLEAIRMLKGLTK